MLTAQADAAHHYASKSWKDWTPQYIVEVQLFQEELFVPVDVFLVALSKLFRRHVCLHELRISNMDKLRAEYHSYLERGPAKR